MPPRAAPNQLLDVLVPLAGLDISVPYTNQTRATPISDQQVSSKSQLATTPIAVNVRGFDASQGRRRLSRRMGQIKYMGPITTDAGVQITTDAGDPIIHDFGQIQGTNPIQDLDLIVSVGNISGGFVIPGSQYYVVGGTVIGDVNTGKFWIIIGGQVIGLFGTTTNGETYAGAASDGTYIYAVSLVNSGATSGTNHTFITKYDLQGNQVARRSLLTTVNPSNSVPINVVARPALIGSNIYIMTSWGGSTRRTVGGMFRIKTSNLTDVSSAPWITEGAMVKKVAGFEPGYDDLAASDNQLITNVVSETTADVGVVVVNLSGTTVGKGNLFASQGLTVTGGATSRIVSLDSDGTNFYAAGWYSPGPLDYSPSAFAFSTSASQNWATGLLGQSALDIPDITGFFDRATDAFALGGSQSYNLSASTGDPITGASYLGTKSMAGGKDGTYTMAFPTAVLFAFNGVNLWSVTGLTPTGLVALIPGQITVEGGGANIGNTSTLTNFNRVNVLVGVSQGTVKVAYNGAWQPTINGQSALSQTVSVIRSAVNSGNMYFADGVSQKYYSPDDNTIHPWVASAGTLPSDSASYFPRLICNWRNRLVQSGLPLDSQNYFMSAVGDPNNWNYNPVPTLETQAVAGNNSPAGLVGDIITALIPYNDDVLIFGGSRSIYQMTGDPAAGGRVDLISDITGTAWGTAWCKTPNGTLYFFSGRGSIYTMAPGSVPLRVSQSIDQNLSQLNLAQCVIRMTYDERWLGVNVWITPFGGTATTHYYYDEATGAWWSDQYGNLLASPFAVLFYDGDAVVDRVSLIGGQDGWVRSFSPTALDDDQTVIASEVLCGPVMFKSGYDVMMIDLQGDLAVTGGSVSWAIQTGYSAQNAVSNSPLFTGMFGPDRNRSQQVRSSGVAIYVALSRAVSELPWSVESLRGVIRPLQIIRQRQF